MGNVDFFSPQLSNFVEEPKTQRRKIIFQKLQNCSLQSLQIPDSHYNCLYENFHLHCRCLKSSTIANCHTSFHEDTPLPTCAPTGCYRNLFNCNDYLARGHQLTTYLLDRLFISLRIHSFFLSLTKLLNGANKPNYHLIFIKYSFDLYTFPCLFLLKEMLGIFNCNIVVFL